VNYRVECITEPIGTVVNVVTSPKGLVGELEQLVPLGVLIP
jgi:hypothetical protein